MEYTLQLIGNYLLFFIAIIILALIVVLSKKYPFIKSIFSILKNGFIICFLTLYGVLLIFCYSFLAWMAISISSLGLTEQHYFVDGVPINPFLSEPDLIKFSVTFGVLYFLVYMGSFLIYSRFGFNVWIFKALVFFTTTLSIIFGYPLIIAMMFPDLTVTTTGAAFLVYVIVVIFIKKLIRREYRAYKRHRFPILYVIYRLIPWLKTGKPPGNNPDLHL